MHHLIRPLAAFATSALVGCATPATTDRTTEPGADTTPVLELAVRRLNAGQDVAAFATARDTFVAQLKAQPGVGTDREFAGFLDFATFAEPSPAVFTGMTQYASLGAFQAAGGALGASAEAGAFFSTFQPVTFTVLKPLDGYGPLDLAGVAPGADDVLEVAVRDLSTYANFDATAYATARDAFLAVLKAQPGVVREYQWVSVLDPNTVVGMTVYADAAAFQAVVSNPAVTKSAAAAAFLGAYPPAAGIVHAVVR